MTQAEQTAAKAKTEVTTVAMQDGTEPPRLVDFAGKRKLIKTSTVTPEGKAVVRLDFRNGQSRVFTIPDGMVLKFACHGAEQKLGDEIAGLKGADGKEADIDDAVLAVDELIDRLYNGEWNMKAEANGMAGTSVLLKALCEAYPAKTVEDIKAFLKPKTQAEKLALRNSAKLKPIVERLEAEKVAKSAKVDTEQLLGELG